MSKRSSVMGDEAGSASRTDYWAPVDLQSSIGGVPGKVRQVLEMKLAGVFAELFGEGIAATSSWFPLRVLLHDHDVLLFHPLTRE